MNSLTCCPRIYTNEKMANVQQQELKYNISRRLLIRWSKAFVDSLRAAAARLNVGWSVKTNDAKVLEFKYNRVKTTLQDC